MKSGLANANADKRRTRRTRHVFQGRERGRVWAGGELEKDADAAIFYRVPASFLFGFLTRQLKCRGSFYAAQRVILPSAGGRGEEKRGLLSHLATLQ